MPGPAVLPSNSERSWISELLRHPRNLSESDRGREKYRMKTSLRHPTKSPKVNRSGEYRPGENGFRLNRHGRSGEPRLQPSKTTRNFGHANERRTGCVGRLAEGMGFEPGVETCGYSLYSYSRQRPDQTDSCTVTSSPLRPRALNAPGSAFSGPGRAWRGRAGPCRSPVRRQGEAAVLRQRLADEELAEDRLDRFAIGARRHVFAERRPGLAGDEVVGIGAAAMRHHRQVVGRGVRGDAQQFGHAADPHHVRLQDVERALLDQPAEAVAGVFVLAGRPFERRVRRA